MNGFWQTDPATWNGAAQRIGDIRSHAQVTVTGTIRTATAVTVGSSPAWRCTLADGTGEIELLFLGRDRAGRPGAGPPLRGGRAPPVPGRHRGRPRRLVDLESALPALGLTRHDAARRGSGGTMGREGSAMKRSVIGAAAALGSMAILTAAMLPFRHSLSIATTALVLIVPVVIGVVLGGFAVGVLSVVAGFLVYDYFFIPPYLTLWVGAPRRTGPRWSCTWR